MKRIAFSLIAVFFLGNCSQSDTTAQESGGTPDFNPKRVVKRFPAIVDPDFTKASEARIEDNELVLGVVVDGNARAYPINMLTNPTREIINDKLGGRAIAATW